jgi:predicted amino acid dehydrogenase
MNAPPTSNAAPYSAHALTRISARRLTLDGIELVQQFGREVFTRGAVYQFIGRKEVETYAAQADLSELEGVHVLLAHDGTVITAYRNRAFHPNQYRKPNYRQRVRRRGRSRWR